MPIHRTDHLAYVLGVDIGTSAMKCCVLALSGELVSSRAIEYSPVVKDDGTAEQHPDEWYRALQAALRYIGAQIELSRIDAVCLTGQMRGLTLIGSGGKPVTNSILWNDTRCDEEAEELREQHWDYLKRITYNPINTMCTLPKILWLKKQYPELWEVTNQFVYPKDYINFKLTGQICTDHSDASGSSIYDFSANGWSKDIIDRFGLEMEKFPKIVGSFEPCGKLTAKVAGQTGLREGIPVFTGGSDATVELYAIGVRDDTHCKIRLGSSCGISVVVDEKQWHVGLDHYCWKPVTGRDIALDINTRFCAQSVKWLRDVFYSEYPKSPETYDLIDREAAMVPPGAEGLIYHPYLQGEDAPYWNTQMRGMFHGIRSTHERRHFARAVLEGVAYSIKDVLDTYADVYRNCNAYLLVGGGAKSSVWSQIMADVLGKNVLIPSQGDAAYGACLIAIKGLGRSVRALLKTGSIKADPRHTQTYQSCFKIYKTITENNCN